MAATSPSVPQLFTELQRLGNDGNYAKAQKVANKSTYGLLECLQLYHDLTVIRHFIVLHEIPDDKDAFCCKVVCLVQQSCFREALDVINSGSRKGITELPFEKAYCLYRLNKTREALGVLTAMPEPTARDKELMAQVYYRLEEYQKCQELYRDLIKNSLDQYGDEREANLSAVIAAASQWSEDKLDVTGLREDTYELCYNSACLSLAQNEINEAEEKLKQAEELCVKSLQDDPDITEEEIESELGIVRTQLGYAHQLQGKSDEAMKLYNQVLKSKPNDIALVAVASNNVITLNKDRDVFDSKKKVKATTVAGLEHKLTKSQHEMIQFNRCLLFLYSNQLEACRNMISHLEQSYPGSDFHWLMKASLLFREKHFEKAIELLKTYAKTHPDTATNVKLVLVQLHLSQGNVASACDLLHSIAELQLRLGVISALVALHTHLGDFNAAIKVLDEAIESCQQRKGALTQSELIALMRENVAYRIRHGKAKEAVEMLEKLHREDPQDTKTLAQLVMAYSRLNPQKAEQYGNSLPALESLSGDETVDLDALETSMGSRYPRVKTKATEGAMEDMRQDAMVKKRIRKKKKGKLPKNYNAEVDPDPERWLPRRERSYYKGKRLKKGAASVGKGTQGATVPSGAGTSSPKTPGSPKPASPPGTPGGSAAPVSNVVPPRQQQPQASKKKQRSKKKKGW